MAGKAPEQALYYADRWISDYSGGVAAGHCRASALLGMGQAENAAKLLEKLAENIAESDSGFRPVLYTQAARAWQAAGNRDNTYLAYSSALSALPADQKKLRYQLYLARGTLQIMRGHFKAAVDDLTHAIEQDNQNFEGFLQRAKAYRKRRHFIRARLDIRLAQKLNKDSADILLESGILYRERGNKPGARQAWQTLIDRYPETDLAAVAQENIDLLVVE